MTNIYTPTDEQTRYIAQENGKIVLSACPGSGKTATIAYKLTKLIPKYEIDNKYIGIACLSFTNVAKDEIQEKYQELCNRNIPFPHLVSTIDHFINDFITLPFFHKLKNGNVRPKIVDDARFLNQYNWSNYKNNNNVLLTYSYPPSTIEFEYDGSYSTNGKKPNENNVLPMTFKSYCEKIKQWQLQHGILKTSDSAFIALQILDKFPAIAKYLVQRFPHIIIDEAQDTSEIQHAIFDKLIGAGLKNIELIGDPYQALYEWRDAKPEIFSQKFNSQEYIAHTFTICQRSSQTIVSACCLLRKASEKKLSSAVTTENLPIYIYRFPKDGEQSVIEKWKRRVGEKYQNNHVLVRGNSLKNKLLGINDSKTEPWKSPVAYIVFQSLQDFSNKNIKKAVSAFRQVIPLLEGIESYHKKKEREFEIKRDYVINGLIVEILKNCPSFDLTLKEWTEQTEKFLSNYFSEATINFELKVGTWNKKHHIKIIDLFSILENPLNIDITTIHGAKGKTFDSTLLFLDKKHAQKISIEDIVEVTENPNENQRMIYVAMSRPRHCLALGIPDSYTEGEIKQKLGNNVAFD